MESSISHLKKHNIGKQDSTLHHLLATSIQKSVKGLAQNLFQFKRKLVYNKNSMLSQKGFHLIYKSMT